ncbi:hypothetical protein BDV23DRAFT_178367 [Aspergillus alliaceus]|uniref:Uncharacterized protein n=1 Tax=Petromyces alliaceus TaxID=209559 RepID=A0A5N7CQK0_PETAA|nr:hypothetical protein BDV23DRAFT_178367 [Aspergillus alliaceus]
MRELIPKSTELILFRWQEGKASPPSDGGDGGDRYGANELCIKATRCGGDANVLTSIKRCLELSSRIAVDQWPTDSFLELLGLCVERVKTPPDLCYTPLGFCIESVICLLTDTRLSLWHREQSKSLQICALTWHMTLGQYYRERPDFETIIFKELLFLALLVGQSTVGARISTPDAPRMTRHLKNELINGRRQITEWPEKKMITDHAANCTNDGDLPAPWDRSKAVRLREDFDMLLRAVEKMKPPEDGDDMVEECHDVPSRKDAFENVRDKYALNVAQTEFEEASLCLPSKPCSICPLKRMSSSQLSRILKMQLIRATGQKHIISIPSF